jgi:hypothetical protein
MSTSSSVLASAFHLFLALKQHLEGRLMMTWEQQ